MVEAIEFVRHAVGGFVHVLEAHIHDDTGVRQIARCGRMGRPNVRDLVLGGFDYEEMCPGCWAATPADHRRRLFYA